MYLPLCAIRASGHDSIFTFMPFSPHTCSWHAVCCMPPMHMPIPHMPALRAQVSVSRVAARRCHLRHPGAGRRIRCRSHPYTTPPMHTTPYCCPASLILLWQVIRAGSRQPSQFTTSFPPAPLASFAATSGACRLLASRYIFQPPLQTPLFPSSCSSCTSLMCVCICRLKQWRGSKWDCLAHLIRRAASLRVLRRRCVTCCRCDTVCVCVCVYV